MTRPSIQFAALNFSMRFIQGYRFLDKCGEALVRLENSLEDGWVVSEQAPTGGALRHYALGMTARFNSDGMNVEQTEFIAFNSFKDQVATIAETLVRLFEIRNINTPAFRALIQVGFNNEQESDAYIQQTGFISTGRPLLAMLGETQSALSFVTVHMSTERHQDVDLESRRRLSVRAVKQTKQPDFDNRIMQRVSLLSHHSREAVKQLLNLRRQHVASLIHAAEFDLEQSFETTLESRKFSTIDFINKAYDFAEMFKAALPTN